MNAPLPSNVSSATLASRVPLALDSRQLFQNGQRQVEILHGEARYSLRLTQTNKLILTK
ncbi:MAG: hemin uptake protein HemP [Zoogloeaceae bacterium]|jgi:hemin uptake protein HemP|nr:hemin uptake protein HemP [Zoogloeaceae bacterium]